MLTTGERIRNRRKELGISADTLAEKIGVSRSTIFRYENGFIGKVNSNKLKPIAEALGTTLVYLMAWEQPVHEYTTRFKNIVLEALEGACIEDLQEACINKDGLYDMVYNDEFLSFETACNIANDMGISIDEILGRNIQASVIDEEHAELIKIYDKLTKEQREMHIALLKGTVSNL